MGLPTTFIRLTGCPLRCGYCDTEYAFYGGQEREISDIIKEVESIGAQYINVTGGEPLAQKRVHGLMQQLCDLGYQVSLETSGALDVSKVDPRVIKVLDVKTPGSTEEAKNKPQNYAYLNKADQVKYVICDQADFLWSKEHMYQHQLQDKCEVLFSPVQGLLAATELANWVLEEKLPVRFQIQLHKYLWGDEPGK